MIANGPSSGQAQPVPAVCGVTEKAPVEAGGGATHRIKASVKMITAKRRMAVRVDRRAPWSPDLWITTARDDVHRMVDNGDVNAGVALASGPRLS
jgi:hypothetical protein